MVSTLESRLIGHRNPIYKPEKGFDLLLGSQPIKINSSRLCRYETRIGNVEAQVLSLEDNMGFTRQIALIRNDNGETAAVFSYQDKFTTTRDPSDSSFLRIGKNTNTLSKVRFITNTDDDIFRQVDKLAMNLAKETRADCESTELKNGMHLGLSGGGVVVLTQFQKADFLKSEALKQAVGSLFRPDGPFAATLLIPQKGQESFMNDIKNTGAQILLPPEGFNLTESDYLLGARLFFMRVFEKGRLDEGNFLDVNKHLRIRMDGLIRKLSPLRSEPRVRIELTV